MSSKFVSRGADKYDGYMGRWSRRLAPAFLDFVGPIKGERVLEVGCGTGSLTFDIPKHANVSHVEAIDYSADFVEAARERNTDPRIVIREGDACALRYSDESFDCCLAMLVLHFVTDPHRALAEMRRVLRPQGIAAATVWDNFGGQPSVRLFWDTVAALQIRADERRSASLMRPMTLPGELKQAFVGAGFRDVTEAMIPIRMDFATFDDYWQPMLTGQGTHAEFLASLSDEVRHNIEGAVRRGYLCGQPDGPRSFVSVAWAVKGTKPG
jgi:SAM-dependent methyltransferase